MTAHSNQPAEKINPIEAIPAPGTIPTTSRSLWYFLLSFALLWGVILCSLVFFSANPVTLNWEQIQLHSQVVVSAKVIDIQPGQVRVSHIWKDAGDLQPDNELTILNLKETAVLPGQDYLIPLLKSGTAPGEYSIPLTEAQQQQLHQNKPEVKPYCYPLTEDAVKQLEQILKQPVPAKTGTVSR